MRANIADKEPGGVSVLKKNFLLNCKQVDVIAACANPNDRKLKMNELNPDLILADGQIPGKSGLEMLAGLDLNDFEITLLTAHIQYIPQSRQFNAADYLLRQIGGDRPTQQRTENRQQGKGDSNRPGKLRGNRQKTSSPDEMKLCVPSFKGFAVLKLEDIVVCEAEKNYTIIHLKNKKPIIVSRSLMEYEKILEGTSFLRIHRSYLINLQHVNEYHRGEGGVAIMSNGTEIEISRRKKKLFMSKIKGTFRY